MGGYAWVTLATNDSYSLGALVLANSLRRVGTVHQLAVLITPGVTNSMREKLSSVYNVVKEVNILDSKDQNNLRLLQRPELGITFTKLNCWRLTQFDKCVFLDADTLLLQNADELFEREEFSAAPDVGWPDCFNSGVYVYKPSEATYENLVKFALQTGSFDGADQGLLNLYFNEWAHKDISKHLPFIYNVCSTATYSYMPAFKQYSRNIKIVHFIGNTKPWLQHFDFETRSVQTTSGLEHLHGIIQQWWEIFCSSVHPVLSQQMASNSAFAENYTSLFFQPHSLDFPHRETIPVEININMRDPWDDYNDKDQTESLDIKSPSPPIHESENIVTAVYTQPISNDLPIYEDICRDVSESPSDLNQCNVEEDNKSVTLATASHDFDSKQVENNNLRKTESPVHFEESLSPSSPNHSNNSYAIAECNQLAWADAFEPLCSITDETALQVNPIESSDENAGLAGAFAQLTLGCPSTVEQRILEDNLRRQNWESGNIDYMGRDAFDNIWSKICDTLSTPETVATQEKEQTTPAATIPENLSEREVSSKLSDDIPSDKSVSKEEKPQECITAPVIDTTSAIKVEPSISVVPSADKPVLPEDSSKIPETKTPTDVVPPPQESVPIAPLVSVTTQPAAQSESVPLKPSAPETTVDTSSIVLEESKIPEVVKVCETQPAEVKDTKCEKSIEESKEPSLATDSSPKQTEAIQSQASDAISSAAIKLSEVAVALPPSDVVVKSLEVLTPETISQTSAAPIIECVKTDEKPSEVVSEKPQCVPISEPSPQTKELETQPSLPTTCPLTESSQVEATKATTTPQQTKVCDAPKPKETQKSSSPSECSLKKSPEDENKKSESSKPQQTPKSPSPTECSLKKSPEDENKKSESSKPQQTPKSPPPTECSLKKSQEAEPAKVETKKSESSKPQQTPKPPSPSERSAKKSPEVEPAKVVIKETESSKSQQTPKSAPPTERSAKKSPEGKPAQVASKESGIAKPQESPKSPQPTECSLKKTPEAETAKGISVQEIKGSGTTKPQETQKLPQADAAKTAKLASTAPQQPKEAGAPKPESQKVESEKEPKPSTKAQSSEAAAVSGSQQGPAPPPRKSGGTKKASGKSKK